MMRKKRFQWQPVESLLVLLFAVNLYFHANKGGTGFNIPGNILVWLVALVIIVYGLWRLPNQQKIYWPRYAGWLLVFPLLSLYVGFLSGIENAGEWLFRILFVWGGVLFFFILFQFSFTQGRIDRLLLIVVFIGMLHGIAASLQVLFGVDIPFGLPVNPYHVPTGIFQQINVQASFQATVLMIVLWLFTRPIIRLGTVKLRLFLYAALVVSTFVVVCSGSRVAYLGLILALPLMLLSRWRWVWQDKKHSLTVMVLIACVITGSHMLEKNQRLANVAAKIDAISAGYSGSVRLGIYSIALELVEQAPWLGHGIGSFVRVWQLAKPGFYARHPDASLPIKRLGHPHNELIYWLVEGGIIMAVSLLVLALAIGWAIWQLPVSRRYAYMALLIPIALHTQVELPFYISSLHWFLWLFLLFMALKPTVTETNIKFSEVSGSLLQIIALFIMVTGSAFLIHTLAASFEIKRYLHRQVTAKEPFARAFNNPYFRELVTQHRMRALLFESMDRGVGENVRLYAEWGRKTLKNNPHIVIYKTTAQAYEYLNEHDKLCAIAKEGHAVYPMDKLLDKMQKQCHDTMEESFGEMP